MNTINEAKARVCKSLLNRVEHYDKLLDNTDLLNEKERVSKLYEYQLLLLNRLERVVAAHDKGFSNLTIR
jgi:hypothetical protein